MPTHHFPLCKRGIEGDFEQVSIFRPPQIPPTPNVSKLSAIYLKLLKYQAWHAHSKAALKGAQHGTDEGYFKTFIRQSIALLAMTHSKVNIGFPRTVLPVIAY